jgi:hypothetical protein
VNMVCKGVSQNDFACAPATLVGTACGAATACAAGLECQTGLPGGYCAKVGCPCGAAEVCVAGKCVRACASVADCRVGYGCIKPPGGAGVACWPDCRALTNYCVAPLTCSASSGLCV